MLEAALDAENEYALRARGYLVDLYEAWGKPEQAAAYRTADGQAFLACPTGARRCGL